MFHCATNCLSNLIEPMAFGCLLKVQRSENSEPLNRNETFHIVALWIVISLGAFHHALSQITL